MFNSSILSCNFHIELCIIDTNQYVGRHGPQSWGFHSIGFLCTTWDGGVCLRFIYLQGTN
jgi:hypothetical protein